MSIDAARPLLPCSAGSSRRSQARPYCAMAWHCCSTSSLHRSFRCRSLRFRASAPAPSMSRPSEDSTAGRRA